jgi:hypothetical protein
MIQAWRRLDKKQKIQTGVLIIATLLTSYAFWMSSAYKAMNEATNAANRKADRLEKRQAAAPTPDFSSAGLEKELENLKNAYSDLQLHRAQLSVSFLPLNDNDAMQNARRRVTDLASRAGLKVTRFDALRNLVIEGEAPTPEEVRQMETQNRYGRPLMRFQSFSSYQAIRDFLFELSRLDIAVVPVKVQLELIEPEGDISQVNEQIVAIKSSIIFAL